MATLKNTTISDTGFLQLPSGTTAQRPGGNQATAGMIRYNTSFNINEYYDGTNWRDVATNILAADGSSSALAATSAANIKTLTGTNTNGVYWINLPTAGNTQIYCIMDSAYDGGGWMMALKATRGTTFSYTSTYWTTTNTLNPTDYTQNDADAKFNSFNYFQAKDVLARWPDIGSGGSIPSLGSWIWLENDFIGGRRQELVNFFQVTYTQQNGGAGLFKRDAKSFSGWRGDTFSSQVDIRFYGFNYVNYNGSGQARWGFGWNENGEGVWPGAAGAAPGSNDVFGGIGLGSGGASYSAGDRISCCSDNTGINRSARVEVYVR
jgi:hypothetical protein